MGDQPDASGLLDVALLALRERLVPLLRDDARIEALKIIRALEIARRELDAPSVEARDAAALLAAIRAGRHDDDAGLHASLLAEVRARVAVANPADLKR
jgi:hypothetical protein